MMNKVEKQQMTFCLDQYNSDEKAMWRDIANFVEILIRNENICTIKGEDCNVVVIDYEHDDSINYYGVSQPIWLSIDEIDNLAEYRSMRDDAQQCEL